MKIIVREGPQLYTALWEEFLEIPPFAEGACDRARQNLQGRHFPREELFQCLYAYNQEVGNDTKALQNIAKLKNPGSFCVVTGQQVGLMGGPAYTILKAITCVMVAQEVGAAPVFWAATEDHDISEVNHTFLVDEKGNLKRFHIPLPQTGLSVEDLTLSSFQQQMIFDFLEYLSLPVNFTVSFSYAKTMISFLARLFSGTGLVFLEPHLLRPLAVPFFQKEITGWQDAFETLQATNEQFKEKGGQPSFSFERGTNLFLKQKDGKRTKITPTSSGFIVGKEEYSESDLLALVKEEPGRFSPNVAGRPVLQSLLLPTVAYVAGPGEVAYYHLLKAYHHWHGIAMPWVVPRISATILTKEVATIAERCSLAPWQEIPHHWRDLMPDIELEAQNAMQKEENRRSAQAIKKHIYKSRLQEKGLSYDALHKLRNTLHPYGKSQERVLNWLGFQVATKENLIEQFLQKCHWREQGHHYCYTTF